jgi:hypothetical protein
LSLKAVIVKTLISNKYGKITHRLCLIIMVLVISVLSITGVLNSQTFMLFWLKAKIKKKLVVGAHWKKYIF